MNGGSGGGRSSTGSAIMTLSHDVGGSSSTIPQHYHTPRGHANSSSFSSSIAGGSSASASPALAGGGGGRGGAYTNSSSSAASSPYLDDGASSFMNFGGTGGVGVSVVGGGRRPSHPEVITGPDGEMIVVEHVVALHDFQSNNPTCLSFQAGQVIRVYNRDASGWWDGELDGERGWFPSNYVDRDGESSSNGGDQTAESVNEEQEEEEDREEGEQEEEEDEREKVESSAYSTRARAGTGASSTYMASSVHSHSSHAPSTSSYQRTYKSRGRAPKAYQQGTSSYSILDPILHAIALLHHAVRASRVAHFQPSTACVISSVRSVLSATDCLTRESPVLRAHPPLARERKQILSVLSRLVTQARKASAPMPDEGKRGLEMESMLRQAEMVLSNVKSFLDVAVECGLQVPDKRSSVYDELYSSEGGAETSGGPIAGAREHEKTPTPDSSRYDNSTSKVGMSNLRVQTNHLGGAFSAASSDAGSHRLVLNSSSQGSIDSNASSTSSSPGSMSSTPVTVERTAIEVLSRLNLANDQLLSVIAAFIGHVHTHTRESHASSYAHLIDMTREAVDAVRAVLVVVEAVHTDPYLQSIKPREMDVLFETRESLYEATTALVTAARVITGVPSVQARHAEEEEKSGLLQAATAVLRTGGECVGAVKSCVDRNDTSIRIRLSELVGAEKQRQEEDEAAEDLAGDRYATVRRRKNTLSYLGRKASSLNYLRDQYGGNNSDKAEGEENGMGSSDDQQRSPQQAQTGRFPKSSSNGHHVEQQQQQPHEDRLQVRYSARARSDSAAARSRLGMLARRDGSSSGDQHSDGSEFQSRDYSRTSGSVSYYSHVTPDTSARPSIDRRESDPVNIENPAPQTAPLNGRFPRDLPPTGLRVKNTAYGGSISEAGSPLTELPPVRARDRSETVDSLAVWSADMGIGASGEQQPAWMGPSYAPADIALNAEKQVIGGTLAALVEKLTPHDTTADAAYTNTFATCFRMFTTPAELVDAMFERYHLRPPADAQLSEDELRVWEQKKVLPVRLRVINFIKNWLEFHYQPSTDAVVVDRIIQFATAQEQPALQRAAMRLKDLARRRSSAGSASKVQMMMSTTRRGSGAGTLTRVVSADQAKRDGTLGPLTELSNMYSPSAFPKSSPAPPAPVVSKTLITHLRIQSPSSFNVTDFDPLELARQITVMESKLYCAILPEELLGQEFSKKAGVSGAVHVKGMSSLSTHLTGWISECILGEEDPKKRRDLLKFFIKLGDVSHSPAVL